MQNRTSLAGTYGTGRDWPECSWRPPGRRRRDQGQREKADGKPIHELEIAENLLTTCKGIRWVMPFELSAESMEASKRRKAMS